MDYDAGVWHAFVPGVGPGQAYGYRATGPYKRRSRPVGLGEFATRFAGSSDLYGWDRRHPTASVNLITVHDGFTLRNLVSYDGKHNEANGESFDLCLSSSCS